MSQQLPAIFQEWAANSICDDYYLSVRYLCAQIGEESLVVNASIGLYPLPPTSNTDFTVQTDSLFAGQASRKISRVKALQLISDALDGNLQIGRRKLRLQGQQKHFYSESLDRDIWFREAHIQVSGEALSAVEPATALQEDASLRAHSQPFDGVTDLASSLGLADRRGSSQSPSISIRIGAPVDVDLTYTKLADNKLTLKLIAHAKMRVNTVCLGVRVFPGRSVQSRFQAIDQVNWKRPRIGIRIGLASVELENAESTLVMLSAGGHTIRRQWFLDPIKATNRRLMATRMFDRDLKQLKGAVLESTDSTKFEFGIASLLFLLGFAPAVQLETQAPDIVAMTPSGTIILVECTVRVADFQTKTGKLVDRLRALTQAFKDSGQSTRVEAFLVSAQARAQVAADERALAQHDITLLCREHLLEAFNQVHFPRSPDELIENAHRARTTLLSALSA